MVARTPAWNPGSTDVPPRLPCLDRLACADEGDRIAVPRCRLLFWFLDAGNDETLDRLSWPASKKRQGTKSREVGHWLAASAMEN